MQDIEELRMHPYPNIQLHVQDDDLTQACLVVQTDGWGPVHMTVMFGDHYPLAAPQIKMDSNVDHPNVFGDYICASILNTDEGYTPAYTLKAIAIQMLSFFASENLDQHYGHINLAKWKQGGNKLQAFLKPKDFACLKCFFNYAVPTRTTIKASSATHSSRRVSVEEKQISQMNDRSNAIRLNSLPNEILLLVCEELETEELFHFAEAWSRIGRVLTTFDVIRVRELQCFFSKKGFKNCELGVGIRIDFDGRMGTILSEFDLLSREGYFTHHIRRSVQGVSFQQWLPLPISRKHWDRVSKGVGPSLREIRHSASLGDVPDVKVLYHFMSDIVVNLNLQTDELLKTKSNYKHYPASQATSKSTLTHASEKAIESYFHLFHLLLCLATADPSITTAANAHIDSFMSGQTSKSECPNLGHLMVDLLIADTQVTSKIAVAIIQETITRNVVWMLSPAKGNAPELAYLEPSAVSTYRLSRTFEASKTSYRLLLFQNLFRKTVRPDPTKTLAQVRDELFDRHGAPPQGAATRLANDIKRIHQIDGFNAFLAQMGTKVPTASFFTELLRQAVRDSMDRGYSRQALKKGQALWLRLEKEPDVERADGVRPIQVPGSAVARLNWFPQEPRRQGGAAGRGRGMGGG